MRIAIVVSTFHKNIAEGLLQGARKALKDKGVSVRGLKPVKVPGAFELPFMCQTLIDCAKREKVKWDGIVALGAVIKGETDHYKAVCQGVTYGLQKTAIENRTPIMFGVLMCRTMKQARDRSGKRYENNKGYECVSALFSLLQSLFKIAAIRGA